MIRSVNTLCWSIVLSWCSLEVWGRNSPFWFCGPAAEQFWCLSLYQSSISEDERLIDILYWSVVVTVTDSVLMCEWCGRLRVDMLPPVFWPGPSRCSLVQLDDFEAYFKEMSKDSAYKFSLQFEVPLHQSTPAHPEAPECTMIHLNAPWYTWIHLPPVATCSSTAADFILIIRCGNKTLTRQHKQNLSAPTRF